jgi:ABC-2 type transport system permease protein
VAVAITPEAGESNPESLLRRARIERAISLTSPRQLYTDSTVTIMDPMLKTNLSFVRVGMMEQISLSRFSGPLPLIQSILVVLPYIISLLAITVVCFAISYIVFMRQEIRSL